jgi:hypothetical protein
MAPTTRHSRSPTPAASLKSSREASPTPTTTTKKQRQDSPKITAKPLKIKARRADRAQSLPISSRTRSAQSTSPRKTPKELEFDLQAIKPRITAFCHACNAKIPTTPEVNEPARNQLESQLMSSILQARGRAVNIESAYVNAKQQFDILGNQDESIDYYIGIAPDKSLDPPDGTKGRTDEDSLPFEWEHAPYTVELAKGMCKVVSELGKAQMSSQQSLAAMEKALEDERKRIDSNPDDAAIAARKKAAGIWWRTQKNERVAEWKEGKQMALEGKNKKKRKPKK